MLTFEEFLLEQDLSDDDARSILGLKVGYSPNDLKAAYHRAAKVNHPDSPSGNPERMKQVNAAYSRLKNSVPNSVVTPSTVSAQMTASSNDPDAAYKKMRDARRAELLSKIRK
jgi:hypothetical protein